LKIGLDIRILHFARTGFFRYVKGLLESSMSLALDGELVVLQHPDFKPREICFERFPRIAIRTPLFVNDEADSFNREIQGLGLDLVHFPCSLSFPVEGCAGLVTIHDLSCARYAHTVQAHYRTYYLETLMSHGRGQHVIVDSDAIRAELLNMGYSRHKVCRVYPDTPFERRCPREPRRWNLIETERGRVRLRTGGYVLSVGSIDPRKNLPMLVHSYQGFRAAGGPRLDLVLVSHHGWDDGELANLISGLDCRGDIHIATHVLDEQLAALYRHCAVCVFTSTYEGFGFVPLEALRYGAPLLSSATPSLVEAGFPKARLIESGDSGRLIREMLSVCNKRDEFMRRQSIHASDVARYYKQQSGTRMVDYYRRLLSDRT